VVWKEEFPHRILILCLVEDVREADAQLAKQKNNETLCIGFYGGVT
jgi:hypothetical protein